MKKLALYVRVSSQEQKLHGLSVDSQITALIEYANAHNCEYEVYNDAGFSAHSSYKKRPEMKRMISDCQKGKISLIVVTKLDRFFRSVPDYYEVMSQINGVPWRAIWEDYETETSSGQFKVNIMLSIAQAESERTSERIKAVNQYKRDKGEWVASNLPWGYVRDANKKIIKDKDVAHLVNLIISTFERTSSLSETAIAVHSIGATDVTKYKIKNVLTKEFYMGIANMEEFEPYLTKDQFERFTSIISRRSRERCPQIRTYIFKGLLRCEKCGRMMLSKIHYCQRTKSDGTKYNDTYKCYRCGGHIEYQCIHSFTMYESKIEQMVVAEVDRICSSSPYTATFTESEDKVIINKIKALNGRIKRLTDMYELGDIDREQYLAKRDMLKLEMSRLESSRQVAEVPQLPSDWKDVYYSLDDKHKASFWNGIIKSIVVHKKSVEIVFLCP